MSKASEMVLRLAGIIEDAQHSPTLSKALREKGKAQNLNEIKTRMLQLARELERA